MELWRRGKRLGAAIMRAWTVKLLSLRGGEVLLWSMV